MKEQKLNMEKFELSFDKDLRTWFIKIPYSFNKKQWVKRELQEDVEYNIGVKDKKYFREYFTLTIKRHSLLK